MNNKRRKKIGEAIKHIEVANLIVEDVLEEEQDSLDNIPENLQDTEMCEGKECIIDCLDGIQIHLDDIIDSLKEVIE